RTGFASWRVELANNPSDSPKRTTPVGRSGKIWPDASRKGREKAAANASATDEARSMPATRAIAKNRNGMHAVRMARNVRTPTTPNRSKNGAITKGSPTECKLYVPVAFVRV